MAEPTDESRLASVEALLAERDLRYNERFDAQEKANDKALEAATKATDAALAAVEKATTIQAATTKEWQSAANEWRQAMNDREAKFLPRAEYDEARKAARSFTLATMATAVGVASLVLALVTLVAR